MVSFDIKSPDFGRCFMHVPGLFFAFLGRKEGKRRREGRREKGRKRGKKIQ